VVLAPNVPRQQSSSHGSGLECLNLTGREALTQGRLAEERLHPNSSTNQLRDGEIGQSLHKVGTRRRPHVNGKMTHVVLYGEIAYIEIPSIRHDVYNAVVYTLYNNNERSGIYEEEQEHVGKKKNKNKNKEHTHTEQQQQQQKNNNNEISKQTSKHTYQGNRTRASK
jgi:hypothetical protein